MNSRTQLGRQLEEQILYTEDESCHYCEGNCPNEPDDSENLCDGFAGDIDGLYAEQLRRDEKNEISGTNMSDRTVSTIYVVYHDGYGGFHINADEYNWLAQHRPQALARIGLEDPRHIDSEGVAHPPFYGTWEGSRHDPDLVACVRALTPPLSMPRAERRLRSKNRVEEFQGAAGLMAYRVLDEHDGWERIDFLDLDDWASRDSWAFSVSDAGIPPKEIKYD